MHKKWKIYIVTHKEIYSEFYKKDAFFNYDNYDVLNVNTTKDVDIIGAQNFNIISQRKFNKFEPLGANYAESEALWNLWKEGLHKNLDFIGFIHYDVNINFPNKFCKKNLSLTNEINKYIKEKETAHISFQEFNTKEELKIWGNIKNVQPLKSGKKIGYYEYILKDYNEFFKTNYTNEDFIKKQKINLCSMFLIDTKSFDKMMSFFDFVIKKGRLNSFDISKDFRLPGGLAERYFGVFMLFNYKEDYFIPLLHQGATTSIGAGPDGNMYERKTLNLCGLKIKYKKRVNKK